MCSREEEQRAEKSCQHKMQGKSVLNRQKEFDAVYKKGKSQPSKYVILFYKKNNLGRTRISYLASKKVGNSVKRNRARRLMREAVRLSGPDIATGYDLVFIARQTITEAGVRDVIESVSTVLRRSRGVLM